MMSVPYVIHLDRIAPTIVADGRACPLPTTAAQLVVEPLSL